MNYLTIEEYLNLPWTYTIETEKDYENNRIYIIYVNELPGVCTDAPTIQEGLELIKDAMAGTFRLFMKHGEEIPVPKSKYHN